MEPISAATETLVGKDTNRAIESFQGLLQGEERPPEAFEIQRPDGQTVVMHLPSGPTQPPIVQTLRWLLRPISFLESCRRRFGDAFSVRFLGFETPMVMLSDPEAIRALYANPEHGLPPGPDARAAADPRARGRCCCSKGASTSRAAG